MYQFDPFLQNILNNISDHIVVIDYAGEIVFTNKAWDQFSIDNDYNPDKTWLQQNYLQTCDNAALGGDEFAVQVAKGIRQIINKELTEFYFEYPCHSPNEKRWFMMTAKPMQQDSKHLIVITHTNITERKLTEEAVEYLSKNDPLTNIANRRQFDKFLDHAWKQNQRKKRDVVLALVDLDCFKHINDQYGHQTGDKALIEVSKLLTEITQRPTELCARYGGDEFIVVYTEENMKEVYKLLTTFQKRLDALKILNGNSECSKHLTTSIGLASLTPTNNNRSSFLIEAADRLLYCAKNKGRNTLVYA
ncbi:MAG: sensor domain-containing diguanylate cyclase [Pseudomonadota bacterium]|nr:sensor domain-containing diguanylate cyclase [Pseudomonadota bacterium]